jgi:hypothetical protein
MSREASELPSPSAPSGLKDRILERLLNGERVILPVADPARPALPGRRIAAAFAATATVAIAASIFSAPELASEASDLQYFPAQPEMGDVVEFEYTATTMFSGEDSLVLRGVPRSVADGNAQHDDLSVRTIGVLRKEGDGAYRASVRLPDDVVYVTMAVEDSEGNRVDSRGQALWELMVYEDEDPSYYAMLQKVYDVTQRDWKGAIETATQVTRLYPDRPGGWMAAAALEQEFYGVVFDLMARPRYLQQLARLDRVLGTEVEASAESVAEMFLFAWTLGDSAAMERWKVQMLDQAPSHRYAIGGRVREVLDAVATEPPARALVELERLWDLPNIEKTSLPQDAFEIAVTGRNGENMELWLDRLLESRPSRIDQRVAEMTLAPSGVDVGIRRLRSLYDDLEGPENGPRLLSHTASEHERYTEDRLHALGGLLGRVLIERGEIAEGLGYLAPALDHSWDVQLFSDAAEIFWGWGDKTEAFEQWARVAVDGWTDASTVDSLAAQARETLGPGRWEALLRAGRTTRFDHFMNRVSLTRPVDLSIQVVGSDDASYSLGELMAGRISVFAFWSQQDFRAVRERDSLIELSRRLGEYDAELITLVTQPGSESLELYRADIALPFRIYRDLTGEVVRAFDVWHYTYFVIDASGMVRFAYSNVTDALNQVAALRHGDDSWAVTSPVTEEVNHQR